MCRPSQSLSQADSLSSAVLRDIRDTVSTAERDRLLEKLSYVAEAASTSQENQRHDQCLRNTRVKVLDDIKNWIFSKRPKCIFWLQGRAGTGKSTIVLTVTQQLQEHSLPVASYFFKRSGGDLAHARKLNPTIAYQFALVSASFQENLLPIIQKDPAISTSASIKDQYEKLVIEPLRKRRKDAEADRPFVIVIDALDECDEKQHVRLFLRLLANTADLPSLNLCVFITSRPDTPIELEFQDLPNILFKELALHNVPRDEVDNDIKIFLEHKLAVVRRERRLPTQWPEQRYVNLLVTKSAGLFIFAATACRYIDGPEQADPQSRLDQVCRAGSTTKSLKDWINGEYIQEELQDISDRFRRIVGSIVILFSPLSAPELLRLLFSSQQTWKNQQELDGTLRALHAVLDVPRDTDQPVQAFHLSFRDFLLDQNRCGHPHLWVDERHTHLELANHCLDLMSSSLRPNICHLQLGTMAADVPDDEAKRSISPSLQYACWCWMKHVQNSSMDVLDNGPVHNFLRLHLLHWLEAMSLTRKVTDALHILADLATMTQVWCLVCQPSPPSDPDSFAQKEKFPLLYDFVLDNQRFSSSNRHRIENALLHIYTSCLLFSPSHCILRKNFQDVIPRWIECYPQLAERWGRCIQVLEGHSDGVRTVAFSPDGRSLISASFDGTARLWDTETGECSITLRSDWITTAALCPNGCGRVLTGTRHNTVLLWDAATGESLKMFRRPQRGLFKVGFSLDGFGWVLTGSDGGLIELWHAETGECRSTFKGHSGRIATLALSPDARRLVSISYDGTIRLWDVKTGECGCFPFADRSADIVVEFSPDGSCVGAGQYTTVRVLDAQTGECRSTLEGHSRPIATLAFSPDGQSLVSGSDVDTVRLWNLNTGMCRRVLYLPGVDTVAFSPDGGSLALSLRINTVQLWDLQTDADENEDFAKSNSVRAMVLRFSLDGRILASGSMDGMARLWNAGTGESRTLQGHSYCVYTVAFSPDGRTLASGSFDKTIMIWDTKTGTRRRILTGDLEGVSMVAFSSDGRILASGSFDGTVRLWDISTGDVLANYQRGIIPTTIEFRFDLDHLVIDGTTVPLLSRVSADHVAMLSSSGRYIGITKDGWLMINSSRIVWLPPEYRPGTDALHGNKIAIGTEVGRVFFLRSQSRYDQGVNFLGARGKEWISW